MSGFYPAGGLGSGTANLLKSQTLGSPQSTISVSGIAPSATTLLVIGGGLISTAAALTDSIRMRINGDAGATNYGSGPAGTQIAAGFTSSWQWTVPAATMNAEGGFTMYLYGYNIAGQIAMGASVAGRTALAGTSADFLQGSSNGIWSGPGPVTSIALSLITGPNFQAGGYLFVYGL